VGVIVRAILIGKVDVVVTVTAGVIAMVGIQSERATCFNEKE
jgi:hypothetical protein